MTDYAYGPGEWTALAHGGRGALLDPAIDAGAVDQIWELLSHDGGLESWLEVLAGGGLAALPSFGLVEPGDDGVRVVVRGGVTALVDDYEISAGGMRTWREHVAPAGTGVVLRVTEGEVQYPLVGGVVLASALQVGDVRAAEDEAGADDADDHQAIEPVDDAAAVVAAAGAEPEPGAEPETPEPESSEPESSEPGSSEPGSSEPESSEPESSEPESSEAASVEAAESTPPLVEAEVEPDFVLDDEDDEDDLGNDPEGEWAQRAEAVQLTDLPDGEHAAGELPPWAPPPGVVPSPAAAQWGPPGAGAAQAPPSNDDSQLGDHDGYTMRASDLPGAHEGGGDVGHTLAPAHEDAQDAGGSTTDPQVQLSLSTGQQIELDRPVLIGRAPESSRFGFGQTPRLVTVPSPQQDISRTHVEIKLEGDSVLVTDLRSTNGTVVVLPGSPPRRLHPGESVPVPEGTVVDLGDGVTAVVGLPAASTTPIAY